MSADKYIKRLGGGSFILGRGFTLIEMVVGLGIFAILVTAVLGASSALNNAVKAAREKTIVSALAANYLEIVRNLPYSRIGTINGNPPGGLPDFTNAQNVTIQGTVYQIYYSVTYIDDPADGTALAGTDPNPNDYKQVKMFVRNTGTGAVNYFVTNVVPKGLEGLASGGALSLRALNAQGQPVANASIHIENRLLTPNIILDRTTDQSGNWVEVGVPNSVNGYHIVAAKTGYSTDQTYPITVLNPNPTKADLTISNGQVTQASFAIDLVSNLTINTIDQTCQALNGINVNVSGAKRIGENPVIILKFNQNLSSAGGLIALNNIEWDTYTTTLLSGQSVILYGASPIGNIVLLPGTSQTSTLVLGPASTNSLLVIVKDSATGLPLNGVNVHLQKPGAPSQDYYGITAASVWSQQSWVGGSGQITFTDSTRYFADNGNVDVSALPTALRLRRVSGSYLSPGQLESSTFDTGTSASQFTTLTWAPTSQDPAATLKFQIAANNDNTTWTYLGPNGTAATYYTVSGTTINVINNNKRYVRYKVFLSTTDSAKTPVLTSVNINYVSGCPTPGQTIFTGLASASNYNLDASLAGYQTQSLTGLNISGNRTLQILLSR